MFRRKNRKILEDEDSYFFSEEQEQEETKPIEKQAETLGIEANELESYYAEFHKMFNKEYNRLKSEKVEEKKEEDHEVDPLDAFMAENNQEYVQDMTEAVIKTKNERNGINEETKGNFVENEEPVVDFVMELGKKAAEKEMRKNETEQIDFLDEDGDIDYDAIRKVKKEDSKKFTDIKELDHEKLDYKNFRKNFYFEDPEIAEMNEDDVSRYRKKLNMKIVGKNILNPILTFDHLNFDERFYKQIKKQGFAKPTPIQSQGLPLALNGRDVIGIAKTGSGKTLSYIWPLLIHVLDQDPVKRGEGPQALIMCPTRELCQQVYTETKRYGRKFKLRISALLGGESKHQQWKELRKGVEILIATPGRLIDLYKKKAFNFKLTTFVVIDEADRMFGMGFEPQIKAVLNQIRPDRQTLLYSATFQHKVRKLCLEYLNSPAQITIGGRNQANEDIKQEVVIFGKTEEKMEWLLDSVPEMVKKGKVLVFVNHIKTCNNLEKIFNEFARGVDKVVIHGDKLQYERTNIIRKFKKDVNVMIATDVASRGLDIPQIKFVVNYEVPKNFETYVHRVGRTGRAGNKDGVAVTCLMKKEWRFASKLAKEFDNMGLAIPPDLHNLASKDSSYREIEFKRKMGYSKGKHKSSQLLQRALNAGQKDKKGLGFKKKKKKKKSKDERKEETIQALYGDNRSINDQYREMVNVVAAEEYKIKANELYGKDKKVYKVKKRVSRFGNIGEAPKREKFVEVEVSATEYEKHRLAEKKKVMKNKLKDKFRSSFVKSGILDVTKRKND